MKKMIHFIPGLVFFILFLGVFCSDVKAKPKNFGDGYSRFSFRTELKKGLYRYEIDDDGILEVRDRSGKLLAGFQHVVDVVAGSNDFYCFIFEESEENGEDGTEYDPDCIGEFIIYRINLSKPKKRIKLYSKIADDEFSYSLLRYHKGKLFFQEKDRKGSVLKVLDVRTGKTDMIKRNNKPIRVTVSKVIGKEIFFDDLTGLVKADLGQGKGTFILRLSAYHMDSGKIRVLKKVRAESLDIVVTDIKKNSATYYYEEDNSYIEKVVRW